MDSKMNFKDFCSYAAENVKACLPDKYKDLSVRLVHGGETGRSSELVGIVLYECGKPAPVIYLNALYEDYCRYHGYGMDRAMQNISETYMDMCKAQIPGDMDFARLNEYSNWENVKDKVRLRAVPVTGNGELLKSIPCRIQGDIACTYQAIIMENEDYVLGYTIDHSFMRNIPVSEKELHQIAAANSMALEPASFGNVNEILSEMTGVPAELIPGEYTNKGLYVLSNEKTYRGASVIFYPGMPDMIADKFPMGFYVLPSSIHEVMIFPKSGEAGELGMLNLMVREINEAAVRPEERLSDYVHEYDPKTKQLYIAGNDMPVPGENYHKEPSR